LILVLACGCGFDSGSPSSIQHAVVGGTPADDKGVVVVVVPGGQGCTATAISERVVLTAAHCIQGSEASEWRVLVGSAPLELEHREAEYLVSEIRQLSGGGGVGDDLALMLLASDFEYPTFRWAFEGRPSVDVGAQVRHVGYGMTIAGDGLSAGSRNERSGNITEVYSQSLNAVVGACSGDSGGPLFAEDDVLLGVAHDITTSDCSGEARFTRLEPHVDWIATALTDTGGCVPTAWNESCGDGIDNDCNGIADEGCEPADAGFDGGSDAGSDVGSDVGSDSGVDAGDDRPSGTVKGGCSTGDAPTAGGSGLVALAFGVLFALGRYRD
jgi:secreted trypsin-like serine protease